MSCIICLDDDVALKWTCPNKVCPYAMYKDCLESAFEDASGANIKECPSCKTQTAESMLESIMGKNIVRAVESAIRPKIEFEVQQEMARLQKSRESATEYKGKANKLFTELAEQLNMKCPRCSMVFDDYDGCNALSCSNASCRAAFCAVCLQDCGSDAHSHVASTHGDFYDKEAFVKAKDEREMKQYKTFMAKIGSEAPEVCEMVTMMFEKLNKEETACERVNTNRGIKSARFLDYCKTLLHESVCQDRLSLLSQPEEYDGNARITRDHISPRSSIPEEFDLQLRETGRGPNVYRIVLLQLQQDRRNVEWQEVPLPTDDSKNKDVYDGIIGADILANVKITLECCVMAFRGFRNLFQTQRTEVKDKSSRITDTVSITFQEINQRGDVVGEGHSLSYFGGVGVSIIGINSNQRHTMLERYVNQLEDVPSVAVEHWVGDGSPKRLLELKDFNVLAQESIHTLNEQQKLVADPLKLLTAKDVAGPPGTGKTKTIIETVRSILRCTTYNVIVLSERNGAIDAIAQKFVSECLRKQGANTHTVIDFNFWQQIMCFGSNGSMGSFSKLFTMSEKLKVHPKLLESEKALKRYSTEVDNHTKRMRQELEELVEELDHLADDECLYKQCRSISIMKENPSVMQEILNKTCKGLAFILESRSFTIDSLAGLVEQHPILIEHLFSSVLNNKADESTTMSRMFEKCLSVDKKLPKKCCVLIIELYRKLEKLQKSKLFCPTTIEKIMMEAKKAEANNLATQKRVRAEALTRSRVQLSTIGSSHQLIGHDQLADIDGTKAERDTFVIFDEAGCIPCYELLGLSRLNQTIVGLLCVGDKHQLPPYNPAANNGGPSKYSKKGRHDRKQVKKNDCQIMSILDVSTLDKEGENKVTLTQQYRVPRDIAQVLNAFVYNGRYETAASYDVEYNGFYFVDVSSKNEKDKYINRKEIRKCIELIDDNRGYDGIIVLTPYKKQQKQLQRELRRNGYGEDDVPVLTIDQCQGQEADIVILSLVQKPTRFLDIHRFNVALSRVRKKLFMLADRADFTSASRNEHWDCHLIAKNLLKLQSASNSGRNNPVYDSDSSGGYF